MTSEKDEGGEVHEVRLPRDTRDEAKAGLRRMGIEPVPTPPLGLTKLGAERSRTTDPRMSQAPVLPSDLGLSVDFPGAMDDVSRRGLTHASTPTPASWALFSDRSIASTPYQLIAPCLARAFACDDDAVRKSILGWALGLVDGRDVERGAADSIAAAVALERALVPRDASGRPALEEWWRATRAPGSAVLGLLTAVEEDRKRKRDTNDIALFIDSRETPAQRACKLIEMRRLDRHDASVRIEPFIALADAIEEVSGASEPNGTRALSEQALESHTRQVEQTRPEVLQAALDEVERVKRVAEIDRRKNAARALAKEGAIATSDVVILSPLIASTEPEVVSEVLVALPSGTRDAMTRPELMKVAHQPLASGERVAQASALIAPAPFEPPLSSRRDILELESDPSSLDTMEPTVESRAVRARRSRAAVAILIGLASVVILVSSWVLWRQPDEKKGNGKDPLALSTPLPSSSIATTARPTTSAVTEISSAMKPDADPTRIGTASVSTTSRVRPAPSTDTVPRSSASAVDPLHVPPAAPSATGIWILENGHGAPNQW